MPFCAQILDAALFLPGVSAPVTADFSWDPQADAVPGAKAVPAGLRRRLSPLGKAAAEALFSLDAFRNETKAQTEDDAWVFSSRWGDLDASVAQLRRGSLPHGLCDVGAQRDRRTAFDRREAHGFRDRNRGRRRPLCAGL